MSKHQMPKGMKDVSARSTDAFYQPESNGTPIEGELLGRTGFDQDGETRQVYQVKLSAPCPAMVPRKGGSGWEPETASPGNVLAIDRRTKLEGLDEYVEQMLADPSKRFLVWLAPGEKVKLKGGRTMWEFRVGIEPLTAKNDPFAKTKAVA